MNIRMKRGMALVLMASLLLAGSAQALFGLGKSKPETVSPENGPTARDLEIRTYRGMVRLSVGIENIKDILADLEQALAKA